MYIQTAFSASTEVLTIRENNGGSTHTVTFNRTNDRRFFWAVSAENNSLGMGMSYFSFVTDLSRDLTLSSPLTASYTVSLNPFTRKLTVSAPTLTALTMSVPSATFGYTGFTSGTYIGTTSVTGAGCVSYFWTSTHSERAKVKPGFEQKPFYYLAETGDGTPYTIGWERGGSTRAQWNFPFEAKANVFSLDVSDTERWGWDKTIRHLRSRHPFVMHDATTSISGSPADNCYYLLLPESSIFDPVISVGEWEAFWNINNVKAIILSGNLKL